MNNADVIQELYRAFRETDYNAFLRISTDDLEWIKNEGFPGGVTCKGASEVIEGVLKPTTITGKALLTLLKNS